MASAPQLGQPPGPASRRGSTHCRVSVARTCYEMLTSGHISAPAPFQGRVRTAACVRHGHRKPLAAPPLSLRSFKIFRIPPGTIPWCRSHSPPTSNRSEPRRFLSIGCPSIADALIITFLTGLNDAGNDALQSCTRSAREVESQWPCFNLSRRPRSPIPACPRRSQLGVAASCSGLRHRNRIPSRVRAPQRARSTRHPRTRPIRRTP